MSAQVKSKQLVQEHGEVFTNEREVNVMLDVVKQETERIESRFLEPACGDDNFPAEVLCRKLTVVAKLYRKSPAEYMRYAFVTVASIYGVDILEDNAHECRDRLYGIVEGEPKGAIKGAVDYLFLEAVRYVLEKNVLCGDALTPKDVNDDPITFAERSIVTGDKVKRRNRALRGRTEGRRVLEARLGLRHPCQRGPRAHRHAREGRLPLGRRRRARCQDG